ncbi:phospholipase A2 [Mollisia scopiformis]|uniref:Phospholipase A2 n=1 Tax=Mollisia scopiformis TaxID=149040 RepID=A0A194XR51_MOLSC|nr:phospholipase A2 [Mollisia scopiformis]KUJ22207.1 phospholipase A2 [Mollisia scopiformis]
MDPTALTEDTPPDTGSDPIVSLLTAYNELNPASVDELTEVPSPLEYMRCVARNRPFVVRGGAADWEATKTWDVATLKELLKGQTVNVAVTKKGNADSPTLDDEGKLLFVKPHEEQQSFESFIDFVSEQERTGDLTGEVRYAQTQNDNLREEYSALFTQVEQDIPWARIALEQKSEAINFWLGNSRSVTALHKDNYENIYVQIIGQKHFVLLPPLAYACVAERELPAATYVRGAEGELKIEEDGGESVPFAAWDPDAEPGSEEWRGTKYSKYAEPIRVGLRKGDMLYLPALWYHKVSQSCSEEGICCAVNYWHDMEFGGSFYPLCDFVRSTAKAALGEGG